MCLVDEAGSLVARRNIGSGKEKLKKKTKEIGDLID
jgi:hypothetical protein